MKSISTSGETVTANVLVPHVASSVLSGICLFGAAAGQCTEAAEPK